MVESDSVKAVTISWLYAHRPIWSAAANAFEAEQKNATKSSLASQACKRPIDQLEWLNPKGVIALAPGDSGSRTSPTKTIVKGIPHLHNDMREIVSLML